MTALAGLTAILAPAAEPYDPVAAGELPRYIFFNKAPSQPSPHTWRQGHPESFTRESMEEIVTAVGGRGHDRLKIGVSFIFSLMETEPEKLAISLRRLLDIARETDVPVLITLDGQNWWERRPDLWNFWDPELPGYNPENRWNVEWTGWGPEHAVKIGWRNWGRQIRVRPAPNLASKRFLAEHEKAYATLVPILVEWYRELPPQRRYLFGGLKIGWEASINVNAFYYRDGNAIYERSPRDPSADPQQRDMSAGWTFGEPPLGYAAVYTSGIRTEGELTREDIEQVVHQYLARLCKLARGHGLPPHLIFTHQGGTYPPWEKHLSFKPAINDDSIPGWSFYSHDPQESGSLAKDLEAAGRRQWAAAEWWRGAPDQAGWRERFERTLSFRQCRYICVYNWESIRNLPEAKAAVAELIGGASRPSSQPR